MHRTLVDLPGLVHSKTKNHTNEDLTCIREIVNEYISSPRTIILPVISAKNDYACQIILNECHRVDPGGHRTLGIVTKPDGLQGGSEHEQTWVDLVQNRDIRFALGWHVLKNRAEDQMSATFAERNESETSFFAERDRGWKNLPACMVGIESLRSRLSDLLSKHLKTELPDLRAELEKAHLQTQEELAEFSDARSTLQEQKYFLTRLSHDVQETIAAGVRGNYDADFFHNVDVTTPVDSDVNLNRLRAVVHELNTRFVRKLHHQGHKYKIAPRKNTDAPSHDDLEDDGYPLSDHAEEEAGEVEGDKEAPPTKKVEPRHDSLGFPRPEKKTRKEAVSWVLDVLRRSKGRELPGTYNPLIIGQLFREQSEPWKALAYDHVDTVATACSKFVRKVLESRAPTDMRERLWAARIESVLHQSLDASRQELKKVLVDKERHAITYNHYFTTTIQKMRQAELKDQLMRVTNNAKVNAKVDYGDGWQQAPIISSKALVAAMDHHIEQDMDVFTANQVLDSETAYYKVSQPSIFSDRSSSSMAAQQP